MKTNLACGFAGASLIVSLIMGCGSGTPGNHFVVSSDAGSDSSLKSCGQVEPCGGGLAATWTLVGGCANQTALAAEDMIQNCPSASITVSGFSVSGSITFAADMTYSAGTAMESFTFTENVPVSCLNGGTCADLSAGVEANVAANPQPGLTFVSCTGTTNCACTFDAAVSVMGETGTYVASGTTVITTPTGAATADDPTDYCVQDANLHILSLDTTMNTGPMGHATIVADIVAVKQ